MGDWDHVPGEVISTFKDCTEFGISSEKAAVVAAFLFLFGLCDYVV